MINLCKWGIILNPILNFNNDPPRNGCHDRPHIFNSILHSNNHLKRNGVGKMSKIPKISPGGHPLER